MDQYFDVTGKNAIITGAASGLGRTFARCLAEQGANVALVDRKAQLLETVRREMENFGVNLIALTCDVTNSSQVSAAVEAAAEALGRIDILVNNAAIGFATPAVDTTDDEWKRVMDTNVNGMFYFAREIGKLMLAQRYGRIINIGSFHCQVTLGGFPRVAYSTAKGAVNMMSKALAAEWAGHGVTVNTLGPGFFDSEMTQKVTDSRYEGAILRGCPMGRRGRPEELNGALLFLASDASSYMTGQLLMVDGGWTCV